MKPICFFDLETTGTDKLKDRIIEIAIVKMLGNRSIGEYHTYINPGMPIPPGATAVHGITDDRVVDSPTFKELAADIHEFIKDSDLGGYNSNSFDIPMLYVELQRAGVAIDLKDIHFIDVCNIFRRKEERTLSAAYKFYTGGSHDNAHNAMDDVAATINVFTAQLERYPELTELDRAQLSIYCNYDKPRADLAGNFQIDADGDYIFSFGKHKGLKAKKQPDYLMWMLGQDFLPDTKAIIKSLL